MFGPHMGPLLHLWNITAKHIYICNQKYSDETKQMTRYRPEARTQENHKQDHDEPDYRHWQSGADHLKQTEEGALI